MCACVCVGTREGVQQDCVLNVLPETVCDILNLGMGCQLVLCRPHAAEMGSWEYSVALNQFLETRMLRAVHCRLPIPSFNFLRTIVF